jgi:GntR family transcriptional regulator
MATSFGNEYLRTRKAQEPIRGEDHGASVGITMEDVHIDFDELTPLHEQVAAEIRRAIADGEAGPGEHLPPARDLAAVLGVNTNTVLRALRQLREEGLLEFRRGRGITVVGDAPQKSVLIRQVRELVHLARSQGYRRDELIEIIQGVR